MNLTHWPGIDLPIIQAPMAGVQGSALAAAVSSAGGLGSLPCAMLNHAQLRNELAALREMTRRPLNVNFFCHSPPEPDPVREAAWHIELQPYYREFGLEADNLPTGSARSTFDADAAALLEEFRPAIVSFHFGLPEPALVDRVKAWGAKVLSSATTVAEAQWLEAHGVDAIVAQGLEAGGHRGMFLSADPTTQVGSMALVRQIVKAVRLPVIAAGGIADGAGVTAALALGAAAVQIGTAFLLCPEATTTTVHRAALAGEAAHHTAITNVFTGRPARGIVNRAIRELGPISSVAPAFPLAYGAIAPLRAAAEALGRNDFSPLWAGQNASGCQAIPAAMLTRRLAGLGS